MVSEDECIFCKIVRGEIPSRKIYEDIDIVAFLDINPANPGHVLIVPKEHSESIDEISENVLKKSIIVTKRIAIVVKKRLGADGINILQNNGQHAGQIVAHFHIHVIPRFPDDKVVITYQRAQLDDTQLEEMQDKLKIDETIESEEKPKEEKKERPEFERKKTKKDWDLDF